MEIKTIADYYDLMYEKFPDVPKKDILKILNYGWRSLYLHNSYGGDVFVRAKDLWCYIGHLKKDSLKYFLYYIKKLTIKLRVLYKRKNILWDGYYYFALNDKQYLEYIGLKNKRGRPKKNFTFENVYMYLIYDECRINEFSKKYIFRIPYISKIKFKFYVAKLITDKAELIEERNPIKFKDILVCENKYEFL